LILDDEERASRSSLTKIRPRSTAPLGRRETT
jgi:hypothetical protein